MNTADNVIIFWNVEAQKGKKIIFVQNNKRFELVKKEAKSN